MKNLYLQHKTDDLFDETDKNYVRKCIDELSLHIKKEHNIISAFGPQLFPEVVLDQPKLYFASQEGTIIAVVKNITTRLEVLLQKVRYQY